MHYFKMPAYSHLTDLLHLDFFYSSGERRVHPRSPLTTQIAPHLPILVCLYLTPSALFSHTSFFTGAALVLLLSRSRRECWEALGGCVGLLGAHRQTTRSCCQLQARGVGNRNWPARRDILGELTPSEIETPFFPRVYQKLTLRGILGGHVETKSACTKLPVRVTCRFPCP